MAQFESLPDDLLLEEILPSLPLDDLMSLCSTSRRLHALCQTDAMWARRLRLEYPERVAEKPANLTWQDYYFQVAPYGDIPIWMHQRIIDRDRFHPTNPLPSSYLQRRYISHYPNLLILYTTKGLAPIYSLIYMNGRLVQSHQYHSPLNHTGRIILSDDPDIIHFFIQQPVPVSRLTRVAQGRRPQMTPEQAIRQYHDQQNLAVGTKISSLLTFGGIISRGPDGSPRFSIVRRDDQQPTPTGHQRNVISRECSTIARNELITLIRDLGADVSDQDLAAMNRRALCQYIQDILDERGLLLDTTDDPVLPSPYIRRQR
jgi:hypothetical protein